MKSLTEFINESFGKYKHAHGENITINLDVYDGVFYTEDGEWHRFSNAEKLKFEDGYEFNSFDGCEIEALECKLSYPGGNPDLDECYFHMDIYPKGKDVFMEIDNRDVNNIKAFCANIDLEYKKLVSDFIKPQIEKWLNYRGMKFKF